VPGVKQQIDEPTTAYRVLIQHHLWTGSPVLCTAGRFTRNITVFFLICSIRVRSRSIYGRVMHNFWILSLFKPRSSDSKNTGFCRRYKYCCKILDFLKAILMRTQLFWHMTARQWIAIDLRSFYALRVMNILASCTKNGRSKLHRHNHNKHKRHHIPKPLILIYTEPKCGYQSEYNKNCCLFGFVRYWAFRT
jgi:hypothetical protein